MDFDVEIIINFSHRANRASADLALDPVAFLELSHAAFSCVSLP
jgi:hypothetical protein